MRAQRVVWVSLVKSESFSNIFLVSVKWKVSSHSVYVSPWTHSPDVNRRENFSRERATWSESECGKQGGGCAWWVGWVSFEKIHFFLHLRVNVLVPLSVCGWMTFDCVVNIIRSSLPPNAMLHNTIRFSSTLEHFHSPPTLQPPRAFHLVILFPNFLPSSPHHAQQQWENCALILHANLLILCFHLSTCFFYSDSGRPINNHPLLPCSRASWKYVPHTIP